MSTYFWVVFERQITYSVPTTPDQSKKTEVKKLIKWDY